MNTLTKLNEALIQARNGMNGLPGLLGASWQSNAAKVNTACNLLLNGIQKLTYDIHEVVRTYSAMENAKATALIKYRLKQMKQQLTSADTSAHEAKTSATNLSVAIQPVIGHLTLLKQQLIPQVDAARLAKAEADLNVEELEYKIKYAGQFVSPFFRPGEPRTRQAVMFPTDISSVTKRLTALIPLKAQANATANTLANRLNLLNATNTNLNNLTNTDELLNACRTSLIQLDGDLESALAKEQRVLDAKTETLAQFYTRKLAGPIAEIQKLLG